MLGAGLVSFVLRELRFPMAPPVLGDLLDKNPLRGLVLSGGDVAPFFTRPISAMLAALVALMFLMSVPPVNAWVTRQMRGRSARCSAALPERGEAIGGRTLHGRAGRSLSARVRRAGPAADGTAGASLGQRQRRGLPRLARQAVSGGRGRLPQGGDRGGDLRPHGRMGI
jgi:hypothetical protein